MTDERRIDRMGGCACMGKLMLGIAGLGLLCLIGFQKCSPSEDWPDGKWVQTKHLLKDLRTAIATFKIEYNHLPITGANSINSDLSLRSRGTMLPALIGLKVGELNPKEIKFIDLPPARERKRGLWQDGNEWVLSDPWGETYYIVIDTNGDSKLTNPEFGADQSDPKYAAKCRYIPPPSTLPASVIVYSSGPDRDPKTWNDNICSWRN
ncbi:MAG: hypothetical protein JNM65_15240 [Verrucomicrobiaceae bacterium]|nr:hypothetical protein [Verrucomicrobiaceae bacterium]